MLLGYDVRVDEAARTHREGAARAEARARDVLARHLARRGARRTDPAVRASQTSTSKTGTSASRLPARGLAEHGLTFRSDLALEIPGRSAAAYQIDLGAFSREGRPLIRNMELVELLPTQGSIRVGPIQVAQRGGGGSAARGKWEPPTTAESSARIARRTSGPLRSPLGALARPGRSGKRGVARRGAARPCTTCCGGRSVLIPAASLSAPRSKTSNDSRGRSRQRPGRPNVSIADVVGRRDDP